MCRDANEPPKDEPLKLQSVDFTSAIPNSGLLGANCDVTQDAVGPFGQCRTNPINVNGVQGELEYLSRLLCGCDSFLVFHRLCSTSRISRSGSIDVYESICARGRHWDVLFLDLYHPRQSLKIPDGYRLREKPSASTDSPIVWGTNDYCPDFPGGVMRQTILDHSWELSFSLSADAWNEIALTSNLDRPPEHCARMQAFAPSQPDEMSRLRNGCELLHLFPVEL